MNFLIKLLCKFARPIDGDPDEWLERDYKRGWREFRCGSCKGIYRVKGREFQILAVHNTKKNDNFDKVLEWFGRSCKRDGFNLTFLEVENPKLEQKLRKLGFEGEPNKMTLIY